MDFREILDRLGVPWYYVGNRLYAKCSKCGESVCLNKPLIGSLHLCTEVG